MRIPLRTLPIYLSVLFFAVPLRAQVTGGVHAFEFLRLPQSPHLSALGGISVAHPGDDVSLALQNPALARPALHTDLALSYNAYYAGISVANLAYSHYLPKHKTALIGGIQYLNYGSFETTDVNGNSFGTATARDYAISLGASREYGTRWRYGAALKFAGSQLVDKSAAAVLADVGIVYTDTANGISLGATARNMGIMVQRYTAANSAEPLPFDLQFGISKRFAHLPLRLMATLHHLYEWDVRYNNPADATSANLFGTQDTLPEKSYFADKLFRHFNFAAELTLGKRLTATVGYNHLRRGELGLKEKKGSAGFSFGATLHLNKLQVQYARSYYHLAGAYNEFGLVLRLNQIVNKGGNSAWSAAYSDWPNL